MRIARIVASTVVAGTLIALQTGAAVAQVPPGTASVESTSLPVRVFFAAPATEQNARAVLAVVERTWEEQVVGMGFAAPKRVVTRTGTGGLEESVVEDGFDLLVGPLAEGALVYFDNIADDPSTARTDCATLAYANATYLSYEQEIAFAVGHVFNHTSLAAIDCLEPPFAPEMFAPSVQNCGAERIPLVYIDTFQELPERSLDFQGQTSSDGLYRYGSALFGVFVEERFGQRDGRLLAEVWRATAQDGTVDVLGLWPTGTVENRPTYFEAFDRVLKARGSSFDEAYGEFAVWRFLTGARADTKHYLEADTYPDVTVSTTHGGNDLPVENARPVKNVARYGSSYVVLETAGIDPGLAVGVAFQGDGPVRWAAHAVCLRPDQDALVVPIALDASQAGRAWFADAARCSAIALVAANLSEGGYDANDPNWRTDGSYQYSFLDAPMPHVAEVSPARVEQGASGVVLVARGDGIVDGPELSAAISGAGVTVDSVVRRDFSTVELRVSAAPDAALGSRDLKVVSGVGLEATLAQAIDVVPAAANVDPVSCGCGSGGALSFGPLAGLLALLRRRRVRR